MEYLILDRWLFSFNLPIEYELIVIVLSNIEALPIFMFVILIKIIVANLRYYL